MGVDQITKSRASVPSGVLTGFCRTCAGLGRAAVCARAVVPSTHCRWMSYVWPSACMVVHDFMV